ncbi:MAG TPA: radical SAM protein [Armatimonadota bacterium]|jgi:biotin synthase
MTLTELETWLRETDSSRLETLWAEADRVRREHVGDEVHLRGLVEISNYCARLCGYCGLRADHVDLPRYRMEAAEILECARQAVAYGYGTVVLQAGEDYGITREWLAEVVRRIKAETPLAVTLSLGERPEADLVAWREAGANRYLLRFETSDPELYARIHPPLPGEVWRDRFEILARLRELGYEVGSGVMIGIPGQSYASLARDIATFENLDLDMIGVGPWLPHPATPLGVERGTWNVENGERPTEGNTGETPVPPDQVPNTEDMTYKVVALTRLVCPEANLPSTTALATLNKESGRELGLSRGANVVMPNLTPVKYRALYEIYPDKACINETAEACQLCLSGRIHSIGRRVGQGPGGRQRRGG